MSYIPTKQHIIRRQGGGMGNGVNFDRGGDWSAFPSGGYWHSVAYATPIQGEYATAQPVSVYFSASVGFGQWEAAVAYTGVNSWGGASFACGGYSATLNMNPNLHPTCYGIGYLRCPSQR